MTTFPRPRGGALLTGGAALLLTAGCATRSVPVAVLPAPVPVVAEAARPVLPDGIPERLTVPVRDATGAYRTINHALTAEQAAWHVRSALNVAVLSCRGAGEAVIAADYNAMLARQKTPLAAAYGRVQDGFRRTGGRTWQTAQDAHSTRVYNFFALPPAKAGFCAVATAILAESRTVEPAAFVAFAQAALPRLEAPFTDVYRRYDAYRVELAAWEARRLSGTMTAQAVAPAAIPAPRAAVPAVAPVAVARALPAAPRLDYVGVDTLLDWQPVPVGRETQLAAATR